MRRFFVQNIFFLILVNLIVKPLWIFGIDRNVQIAVGHEAYGQYVALLNFSIIFQVLLDFGLQNYNSSVVSRSPKIMKGLFPNIIVAKAILALGYICLVMALGLVMGYRQYALLLLLALCMVQVLNSLLLYLRSNVAALHRFKTDSLLSVGDRFFMIAICSLLLFHPFFARHFKIEWFIYAQIGASLLAVVVAFFVCARLSTLNWKHYDLRRVWIICRQSLPYALLIFLMAVYIRSDIFLMERLLPAGQYEAGVYAAAYRFLDVANNITGVLFAGMLLPVFGRMLTRGESVKSLVRLCANLLVPVAIAAAVVAGFWGKEIMKLNLGGMASDYDGHVFSLLMLAFPGYCIGYIYSTLLTANGNLRQLIIISLTAVVLNLGSNFFLMPLYGAWGAALSCVGTQLFVSCANIYTAKRILRLETEGRGLLQYLIFTLWMLGCCYILNYFIQNMLIALLFSGIVSGAGMLLCGFLPFEKIKELLKSR